jgi:uncharacterized ion transporter superfamily protein YfcC
MTMTICFSLANAITILKDCDQVCNYLLHYFQHLMSVLPQITYGNMALIFLSYLHGYNKQNLQTIGIHRGPVA